MRSVLLALALVFSVELTATRTEYLAAKRKFALIETQKAKPGTRISIPSSELNAYVQAELPQVAPPGVRSPRVQLHGGNVATGHAVINFLKLRNASGKASNWLMRKLLDGERDVSVTARIRSAAGKATVDVQRVEIGGVPIEGATLDFVIRNYLIPNYPEAKIGRPFELRYRVERLEVAKDVAYVVMR